MATGPVILTVQARVPRKASGSDSAATRLRAMKLMKLPSGDHVTVSGKTQARSGGIRLRRNSSVGVVEIDAKRRTGFVRGAIKCKYTTAIGRDDRSYECFILAFAGEVVRDRWELVEVFDLSRWRRNVRRKSISKVSRGHVAQHTRSHVLAIYN